MAIINLECKAFHKYIQVFLQAENSMRNADISLAEIHKK